MRASTSALVGTAVGLASLAALPWLLSAYAISVMINLLSYVVLATAWATFSGTTNYISLATAAFFGVGAYVVAALGESFPMPVLLLIAAVVGFLVALAVGLSTLRLSGMYFVIFTFGLAELVRQIVIWWEVNITGTIGRFIFIGTEQRSIYWYLLGLAALVMAIGVGLRQWRVGYALRAIGEDETAANHAGVDTTRIKVMMFASMSAIMSVVGAVMAPRWTYIDPNIVFNPLISFNVVIMALLGGAAHVLGPILGVIPVVLLFEFLSARFPYYFMIIMGACFMLVVYYLPYGIAGLFTGQTRVALRRGS